MSDLHPFHIGSKVRYRYADGSYGDRATVVFAECWPDGWAIRVQLDDGHRTNWDIQYCAHLDGAPLGQWMPLKENGEDHKEAAHYNRVIRMEVEQ